MRQRLTERARKTFLHAEREAKEHGRQNISGSEYLLLGLLRERDCLAARVLERLGASPDRVVAAVEQEIEVAGDETTETISKELTSEIADVELTPPVMRVIDLAFDEARRLDNNIIGTEHLLLGMIREGAGMAARVLTQMEISLERVRDEVRNPLMSMDEAAQFLGVSKPTLYRVLKGGELKGLKVSRQWRFNKWDLVAYTQRSPVAASAPAGALDAELAYFDAELKKLSEDLPAENTEITDEGERKVALLIQRITAFAIQLRASDIHLEPIRQNGQTSLRLRFRIDGALQEIRRLPMSLHESLFLFAKQWTGLDMAEKTLPQNGRVSFQRGDKEFEMRMTIVPSIYGETLVVRILDRDQILVPLSRLGLSPTDFEKLKQWVKQLNGLIITSGPTGSGKTTTLYGILNLLDRPNSKMMTVEDPVVMTLPDAIQTSINKKARLTYPVVLRAIFNQDPDIIMIGDLLDQESAEIGLEMAVTGHLIFIQLTSNTAAEAIHRVVELSGNPLLVAQSLVGVVSQRLARRICANCKEETASLPDEKLLAQCRALAEKGGYIMPDAFTLYRGTGCAECRQTGYRGRTALYEVLSGSPALSEAILRHAPAREVHDLAVSSGMTALFADGMRKVVEGQTTLEEVVRVAPVQSQST